MTKKIYKLTELRPSAVILAAKFLQLKYDDIKVTSRIYGWLAQNGHLWGIQPVWIYQVIQEAKKSPLKNYQRV